MVDRRHHPVYPGFWLHPEKGTLEIGPEEHHSLFFLDFTVQSELYFLATCFTDQGVEYLGKRWVPLPERR